MHLRTKVTAGKCLSAVGLVVLLSAESARGQDLQEAFGIVASAVSDGRIPGAALVVMQDGRLVAQKSFGHCEIDPQRPFRVDTICWIASLTKPVSASAAMQLVEQGKLELDEPIGTYLPEFASMATEDGRRHPISIRQLMSHSSGIPPSVPLREPYFFQQQWYDRSIQEVVEAIAQRPLSFVPGSQVDYSNAAPYVLARLVEVRSGMQFGDYIQQQILDPLGMTDTGFAIPADAVSRASVVYRREGDALKIYCRYDPAWKVNMTMPDGGLFSTPQDIARFASAFLSKDTGILKAQTIDEMLTKQNASYGLGWILDQENQFSHWGSSGTLVWADQETRVVGVFFSQIQDFNLLAKLREQVRAAVGRGINASR